MPTTTARIAAVIVAALVLLPLAPPADAAVHLPHDPSRLVALSPDFVEDRTVFAAVQLTTHPQILRSVDGGARWDVLGAPFVNDGLHALELSPGFADDRTLFAGTDGGLWRSTDAGDHWHVWGSGLPAAPVLSLALSPDFVGDGVMLAGSGPGLFRSVDAGATWSPVTTGYTDTGATRLGFAPDDPSLVFGGILSLHRSDDGGVTWVPLQTFGLPLQALGLSPTVAADGVLAVGFGRFGGGVQMSDDGGASWTPANAGLLELKVNDLALAADGTAFALTTLEACYRAPSLGAPWTLHDSGYEANTDQTSNHHLRIALSPGFVTDGELFVASFEGLHHSTDGGLSWSQADTHNQRFNVNIAVTPGGKALFAANYGGGVLRLGLDQLDDDGGPVVVGPVALAPAPWMPGPVAEAPTPRASPGPPVGVLAQGWSSRSQGLADLYAGELAVSPDYARDRTVFYGLLQLQRSTDGGRTWTTLTLPDPFPRTLALVDDFAVNPTLLYGTYEAGVWISHDRGDTWADAGGGLPAGAKISGLALSPGFSADGRAWLSCATSGVWRTLDGAASWQHVSGGVFGTEKLRCVAVSPDVAADGLVLAGTSGQGLWRSDDDGDTWTPVTAGIPSGDAAVVEAIVFSPGFAGDGVVFVAINGDGVLRSDDGGHSFGVLGAGLSPSAPRDLTISDRFVDDATLFVSTYDWVWRSTDGGAQWTRLPGFLHVDEEHPTVARSGLWFGQVDASAQGGALRAGNAPGTTMEWTFHGRSVSCQLARGPDAGVVDIELDGKHAERLDLYSSAPLGPAAGWSQAFGEAGWHTVRVVVTGLSSPASTGTWVRCDGFRYTF